MRDIETISLALTAAETGHLVIATLHTSSAAQTINRIVDVFPAGEKSTIRTLLSSSLQAVVSQNLLQMKGGGRCAAYEILIANSSVRNLIREDKIHQIPSAIEIGSNIGMISMKDYIIELLEDDIITEETAENTLDSLGLSSQ